MTAPEARCMCGMPAVDHLPLRYAVRAYLHHRWFFARAFWRGRG